ncbi:unnamed protein product [Orchesella dallaii]|uniref:Uncharacterized protein n=1 Tax=Orchesella dallaii TaxID=48710 RepID=A0ABP1S8K8_9HEXA
MIERIKTVRNRNNQRMIKILRLMLLLMTTAGFLEVMTIVAAILLCPDTRPFPSSLISKRMASENQVIAFAARSFLSVAYAWNFVSFGLHGYLIINSVIICVGILYITVYELKRNTNNRFLHKNTQKYQMLQLVSGRLNGCFQNTVFFWFTVIIVMVGSSGMTGCIMFYGNLKTSSLIVLMMLASHAVTITVTAFKFPGLVNWMSKQILHGWEVNLPNGCGKWRRKYILSFREIRIHFGGVNFYEKNTCVNIFDFQIQITINLILLSYRG